jgi:DNA-binding transcriptional ArsR family regulator
MGVEEAANAPPPAPTPSSMAERDRRLLEALGDSVAVSILEALSRGERNGHDLVVETDLPQSSVYRKLRDLQEGGFVFVNRLAFTPERRKVEMFSSRIREVRVEFAAGRTLVRVRPREDSSDRIGDLWAQVRGK